MGTGAVGRSICPSAYLTIHHLAFDLDTVKLLMSMFDTDRSGTIGFNEFAGLWRYIKDWYVLIHVVPRES